eukprot:TRINITY_DN6683_c0_g1_i1.p2 TRINITY_DN6683_c0_g1~~TRINITY_DN6683_c0_g1_i1.p2  ORF type:complete len:88 (-),score=11.48 TRINITY_DN6683_c0_g1_i1:264-527(-)
MVEYRRKGELSRRVNAGLGGLVQWGATIKNDNGAVDLLSNWNMCVTMLSINSSLKGGLASQLPDVISTSKNEPQEPNGASVSGNALQ